MPFYEYQCSSCGHHREELQKVTDRPLRKCPACGRSTLRRLVSAPVFRLKGGGWYETDFKADKEAKDAKDAKDAKEPVAKPEAPKDAAASPAKPAAAARPAAKKPRKAGALPRRRGGKRAS